MLHGQTNESWMWHKRMGGMNFENLVKLNTKKEARDIPNITRTSNIVCNQCQHGKQSRPSFKTKKYTTSKPLELVHTNLYGLTRTKSIQGVNLFYVTY
jgi:hypothetical protein